jgi:hypothetical protein
MRTGHTPTTGDLTLPRCARGRAARLIAVPSAHDRAPLARPINQSQESGSPQRRNSIHFCNTRSSRLMGSIFGRHHYLSSVDERSASSITLGPLLATADLQVDNRPECLTGARFGGLAESSACGLLPRRACWPKTPASQTHCPTPFAGILGRRFQRMGLAPLATAAGFHELFRENLDVPGLDRFVVGRYGWALTPSKQQEFVGQFEITSCSPIVSACRNSPTARPLQGDRQPGQSGWRDSLKRNHLQGGTRPDGSADQGRLAPDRARPCGTPLSASGPIS